MQGSDRDLLLGVLQVAAISLCPVLLAWTLLHLRDLRRWLVRAGRRVRLLPTPVPPPRGRPIEQLAADLRRVRAALAEPPARMSQVRRRGLHLAYDDLLVAACRALEVDTDLRATADGVDREVERLRVECRLEAAGLRIRAPLSRDDA